MLKTNGVNESGRPSERSALDCTVVTGTELGFRGVPGRFGPGSFRPGRFGKFWGWVVSALVCGSFRPRVISAQFSIW